jgi:phosphate/sulfate permease
MEAEDKERADAEGDEIKTKKDESSKMNMKTMKKILFYWAITLPAAFGFCSLLTYILIAAMPASS